MTDTHGNIAFNNVVLGTKPAMKCVRCGHLYEHGHSDMCDDESAAGAGSFGICGGALVKTDPIPATNEACPSALLLIDAVPEDSHLKSLPQRTGSSVRLNPRTRELSIEQPHGGDASNEVLPDGYVLIVSVPDQP